MTTRTPRAFAARPAVREQVPALIGLFGPSGGGKTFSALRLATGVQSVTGGEILVVDTEAKRALHYADQFKFQHVEFKAPFGSLDYLDVLTWSVTERGAKIVVVDSFSHEHEGPGGYLSLHESEVERLASEWKTTTDKANMAGWIKPSANRRTLINGMLQLAGVTFIFCFRAKEKTKPKTGGGIQELGFMPIAGDEFLFEMTVSALLPPNAGGVPTWSPEQPGEKLMVKLPRQFKELFATREPLGETHGRAIAEWARGDSKESQLASRAALLETALKRAKDRAAVNSTWTRAAELRQELAVATPQLLLALERLRESRETELKA